MQKCDHGGDIYRNDIRLDFSVSLNPLGMPASAAAAVRRAADLSGVYPDPECSELRQILSDKEKVPPDWIVFGNGAAELIYALAAAVRPRRALLMAPGFSEYEKALSANGCLPDFYVCSREEGYAADEDLISWIGPETDLIFLCNPNNPTGVPVSGRLLEQAASACRESSALLIVDECFLELCADPSVKSMKGFLPDNRNIVVLRAFTKQYAMAGLRLGYLLSADDALRRKVRSCLQPWNVSVPAQMAGAAALCEEGYMEKTLCCIAEGKEYLLTELEALGFACIRGAANYIFFDGPEGLYEKCLRRGILIRDCSNFRGLGEGSYRVCVRMPEENAELIRVMKDCLRGNENG
ncbi:MAG: aminotransferase class I/II-fold pyridoxal phosphate-dependent enzyme [Lachnospiraceae bacterium]|nr:aminotransferase class I/II-fold pyridoxal phosphate-dependent enzyme [Lachnospiraceae bacterium]